MNTTKAVRLVNLLCDGALDGAQLESLLQGGYLGDWYSATRSRGAALAMAGNSSAAAAIAASASAMPAMAADDVFPAIAGQAPFIDAVFSNASATDVVMANAKAFDAIMADSASAQRMLATSRARLAIWSRDDLLTRLTSDKSQRAIRAAPGLQIISHALTAVTTPQEITAFTGRRIVVGIGTQGSTTAFDLTLSGRRAGSSAGALTHSIPTTNGGGTTATNPMGMAMEQPVTATLSTARAVTLYLATLPV